MIYKTKCCIVCSKPFLQRTKKANSRAKCNRARRLNAVTCCKLCSKIYNRIASKIKQQMKAMH